MSELSSVPAKLFHSAIIPYNPQDLLGRGKQAGLLESGVGGDGGGRSPMSEEENNGWGYNGPCGVEYPRMEYKEWQTNGGGRREGRRARQDARSVEGAVGKATGYWEGEGRGSRHR